MGFKANGSSESSLISQAKAWSQIYPCYGEATTRVATQFFTTLQAYFLIYNVSIKSTRFADTFISATCGSCLSLKFGPGSFTGGTIWISAGLCRLCDCLFVALECVVPIFTAYYVLLIYERNHHIV